MMDYNELMRQYAMVRAMGPGNLSLEYGGPPKETYDQYDLQGVPTGAWKREEVLPPRDAAQPFPLGEWSGYGQLREDIGAALGEYADMWKQRLLGGMVATGDALRGITNPDLAQFEEGVIDALGVYAGPSLLGKPSLTTATTFGGIGARGANKRALDLAEYGWKQGLDPETVRQTTGWFKGMEGKPRFEISDKELKWKRDPVEYEYQQLKDIIEHKELFKQYPELKNVVVRVSDNENLGSFSNKSWGGEPVIDLNLKRLAQENRDPKDTIVHEIQHWIQQKEGFARGGSPSAFGLNDESKKVLAELSAPIRAEYEKAKAAKDFQRAEELQRQLMMELPEQARMEAYRRLAGEIEARDAAGRRTWDMDMRRAVPPTLRDDAIIRMESDVAQAVESGLMGKVRTKFQNAYDAAREAAGGSSWVDIAVLRDKLGLSQEKMATLLRRGQKEGHLLLEKGERAVADDYLKGGAVDDMLLVRLDPEFFDNLEMYFKPPQ